MRVALKLGDTYRQLENYENAHHWYKKAEQIAHQLERKRQHSFFQERMDALCGQAMCDRGLENYKRALTRLKSCLKSYREKKDREGMAYVLWALGTTQRFAGDFKKSERNIRQSIVIYKQLNDPSSLAYAYCGLGGVLRMKGHAKESFQYYRLAHQNFMRLKDQFGIAYSNCGQGNALRMQNRISDAFPYMKRAEFIYRKLKQVGPLGFVLWSQSQAELVRHNLKRARGCLGEAKRLFEKVGDKRGLLYVNLGYAEVATKAHDSLAQSIYSQSLKAATNLALPFERAHALSRIKANLAKKIYLQCGVDGKLFNQYTAFP